MEAMGEEAATTREVRFMGEKRQLDLKSSVVKTSLEREPSVWVKKRLD